MSFCVKIIVLPILPRNENSSCEQHFAAISVAAELLLVFQMTQPDGIINLTELQTSSDNQTFRLYNNPAILYTVQ